jgi:adenylate cyclase
MAEEKPDFEAEGLLDGIEDERERRARLELLEQLHEDGVELDELREAVKEERLVLLPVERVLGGVPAYTMEDMARDAGVPAELLMRERRAMGLPVAEPQARAYGEADLEAARHGAAFLAEGFPEEAALEVLRVTGASLARVAEAMRGAAAEALARPGDTERDLGLRLAGFAQFASDNWADLLAYILRQHLLEQVRGDVITRAEAAAGHVIPGAQDVGVAFADLVGFTRLGERRPVDELGAVAERLAEMASAVAEPPVRLVKTIGDAAMLVSTEPAPLLDATLTLVQAAEEEGEEFPQLRAGMALGPALARRGDWYGHTVNVASRVTGVARAGSVLATGEVHDALEAAADGYRWSFAGERKLKNVKEPVKLFRARAADPDAEDGDGDGGRRAQRKR